VTPGELAATQVRLILERQCADLGREIHAAVKGDAHFILFLVDLGADGNLAFFSNAKPSATVARLRCWLDAGGIVPAIPASAEQHARAVEDMRALGKNLAHRIPAGVGFALLLWSGETALAYASSCDREDMKKVVDEWLAGAASAGGGS
jgi:hypothetical protein